MADKTLGAYQRHEKHTATDFAKAEFARHLDGRVSARMVPKDDAGHQWLIADADATDLSGPDAAGYLDQYTDSGMSRSGWSPVRECPDPEQHDDARDDLLRLGRLVQQAQHDRVGSVQIGGVEIAPCDTFGRTEDENAERRRAEKAEQERDEARGARDALGRLSGRWQDKCHEVERELHQARSERDEMRSLYEGQIEIIGSLRSQLTAAQDRTAQPRPLTRDDITDEMVRRACTEVYGTITDGHMRIVRRGLTAALTVPTRPEWRDAYAVLVTIEGEERVFIKDPTRAAWVDGIGSMLGTSIIAEHDPRPLVERGSPVEGSGR